MNVLVMLLFLLSGACGLVYEVVWTRMMTHVFGSTAVAVGTVLAAFMTGLAVGAWLLGRLADKHYNPLRLYAYLEIGVGVAALIAHLLLVRITPAYVAVYEALGQSAAVLGIVRFVLAFALVVAPTILMGATLPVLTRFVVRKLSGLGSGLSELYAINTLGAVAGSLAAGFFLIGKFGIHTAVAVAVIGNILIGAIAWLVSRSSSAVPSDAPGGIAPGKKRKSAKQTVDSLTYRIILIGLGISGLTSFAYEIYWTRSLVFMMGNSTYAVTTMLVSFLVGIALGGYLIRFLMERVSDRPSLFGWIQILIGVSAAAAMPVLFSITDPESIRAQMWNAALRDSNLTFVRLSIAFPVMLVPATLIGMTFPLVGRISVTRMRNAAEDIGRVYAINTMGNVLGALLPGLVLMHWLGIQRGIVTMAALNVLIGLTVFALRLRVVRSLRFAFPVALVIAILTVAWVPLDFHFPSQDQGPWHRVLYYRDGPSATTAVMLDPDTRELTMSLDGIDIGGNGPTDYKQQLLAHLPKLLLDDVSNELSVGFGSGILAGASTQHDRVRSITCAEIEPTVVEGARLFADLNHGVLDNTRCRIVVDDVANHLRTTRERYNVVSADEKTSQEYASNGFSYSHEYYELIAARLASGGIAIQWVPTSLPPQQYRMVLKTFSEAFPHVLMFFFAPAFQSAADNTILVGSNERVVPDVERMRRWLDADGDAFDGMTHYGFDTAESVMSMLIANEAAIRSAVQYDDENTLVHPRYEFYSPADYAMPSKQRVATNFRLLMRLREASTPFRTGLADGDSLTIAALAAEDEFVAGYAKVLSHAHVGEVLQHFDAALGIAPHNDALRVRILTQYWHLSQRYTNGGNFRNGAELMRRGLTVYDRRALNWTEYAMVLLSLRGVDQALDAGHRAVALEPELVAGRRTLVRALLAGGKTAEAAEHVEAILAIEPNDEEALSLKARLR